MRPAREGTPCCSCARPPRCRAPPRRSRVGPTQFQPRRSISSMAGRWSRPIPRGLRKPCSGSAAFGGAERKFWELGDGVYVTAVGYAGGHTQNPSYEEVCSGRTGHTEVVLVVFDPAKISYAKLLKTFWENHNPTQGMRQGNDVGTQYRSAIYTFGDAQREPPVPRGRLSKGTGGERGSALSRPRSRRRPSSISPRIIISNISPRIRPAIAARRHWGVVLGRRGRHGLIASQLVGGRKPAAHKLRGNQAATPAPTGHDTPVPPSPQ